MTVRNLTHSNLTHRNRSQRLDRPSHPLLDQAVAMIATSGLTLVEIGHRAGVTNQTLGKWMHKELYCPYPSTLTKVADVLGYELVLVNRNPAKPN